MRAVFMACECGLTTQAQRPGARDATIATATLSPGSLERMVRRQVFVYLVVHLLVAVHPPSAIEREQLYHLGNQVTASNRSRQTPSASESANQQLARHEVEAAVSHNAETTPGPLKPMNPTEWPDEAPPAQPGLGRCWCGCERLGQRKRRARKRNPAPPAE